MDQTVDFETVIGALSTELSYAWIWHVLFINYEDNFKTLEQTLIIGKP